MKTEYLLTPAQRYELADIDRRIAELCKRKAEIYAFTNCRYILETKEEIEAASLMKEWLYSDFNMFSKEVIGLLEVKKDE